MDEPDNFGVPYDMITNLDLVAKLTGTVITLLSRARDDIKGKLKASLPTPAKGRSAGSPRTNIVMLVKSLVPTHIQMDLRSAHTERVAWLVRLHLHIWM